MRVSVDTSGAIDVAAERARLAKLLTAAHGEIEAAQKKLANPAFTEKAPAKVIDGIRTRLSTAEADVARISGQLGALPA